jgi:hypothetical protein
MPAGRVAAALAATGAQLFAVQRAQCDTKSKTERATARARLASCETSLLSDTFAHRAALLQQGALPAVFDPEPFERAAKAANELKGHPNAKQVRAHWRLFSSLPWCHRGAHPRDRRLPASRARMRACA